MQRTVATKICTDFPINLVNTHTRIFPSKSILTNVRLFYWEGVLKKILYNVHIFALDKPISRHTSAFFLTTLGIDSWP